MAKGPGSYRFACPKCASTLKAWQGQAGTKLLCPRCAAEITVPTPAQAAAPPPPPRSEPAPASDDEYGLARAGAATPPTAAYVNLVCPVCATRMYTTADQIGSQLDCPDCGTKVAVKAPPPAPPARAAGEHTVYEGSEEYGVSSEAPPVRPAIDYLGNAAELRPPTPELGNDRLAADNTPPRPAKPHRSDGPRNPARAKSVDGLIAVVCSLCHTRMHANRSEAGTLKACPDCGTANVVPAPGPPPAAMLPEPADPYDVSPPAALVRPKAEEMPVETPLAKPVRRRRKSPPPWPFVNGLLDFLRPPDSWGRFVAMSLGAVAVAYLLRLSYVWLGGSDAGFTSFADAITGLIFLIFGAVGGLILLVTAAGQCVAIIEQTAQGTDHIEWPEALWIDWMFDLGFLAMAAGLAGLVCFGIGQLTGWRGDELSRWYTIGGFVVFPIMLMSLLETGSLFNPFSWSIWRSMFLVPGAWFQFYAAAAVVALAVQLVWLISGHLRGADLVAIAPAVVFAPMLYARLIGRLAWCSTDALIAAGELADDDDDEDEDDVDDEEGNAPSR